MVVCESGSEMKKSSKKIVILVVLVLECAWAVWPRLSLHGPVLDEPFRLEPRRGTLFSWMDNPTPKTKAAYDAEVKLLDQHMERRALAILAAVLVVDVAGIYLFWRHSPTKVTT